MIVTRYLVVVAVVCSAAAQAPVVGDVNLYGLRKTTPERILSVAKVQAGQPLPPSKGDMEDRVADLPGVVLAHVEAVCCEGPNAVVFIGIEEKGAPHAAFRTAPTGDATLPREL